MRYMMIILSLFATILAGHADSTTKSRIAAVVNKNIITHTDLNHRLHLAALSSGLKPSPENLNKIKDQLLRVMIDEQLQLGIGEFYQLTIDEARIKESINRIEQANEMPKDYLYKVMKENGIPLKTLNDQIKASIVWIEYIRAKYSPTLQISDIEIARERQLRKDTESKTQYHLAEIVLPFETPEQENQAKADLERLIEELQRGAHFAALAQQFSQAATAAQGGDMGWLTEDQLLPEVREFVDHMDPGMLSRPIRISQGYIIIGYIEKKLPGTEKAAELSEEEAQNIIAEKKLGLLANRELRDLRRHAFIDLRI